MKKDAFVLITVLAGSPVLNWTKRCNAVVSTKTAGYLPAVLILGILFIQYKFKSGLGADFVQ